MAKQLLYEDVEVGGGVTPLVKHPTTRQLVMFAVSSGDLYEMHYDKDFALEKKMPGVIVHGKLKAAFLGQLMTDWIGEQGILKKLTCSYRGMDVPGVALTCKGKVTKKYADGGEHYVECELWIENEKGETTTTGTAVVTLPLKGS